MTDKQQPAERVWLEFFDDNVRGVSVYVPEWHDNTPITHRMERIKQNGFPYARVHSVDDARVEEIRAAAVAACVVKVQEIEQAALVEAEKQKKTPENRYVLRLRAATCQGITRAFAELLPQLSGSERRCGERQAFNVNELLPSTPDGRICECRCHGYHEVRAASCEHCASSLPVAEGEQPSTATPSEAVVNAAREIAAEFNRPEAANWVEAIIDRHCFPPTEATQPVKEK